MLSLCFKYHIIVTPILPQIFVLSTIKRTLQTKPHGGSIQQSGPSTVERFTSLVLLTMYVATKYVCRTIPQLRQEL